MKEALDSASRTFRRRQDVMTKGDLREQALLDSFERLLEQHRIADINVDMIATGAGVKRSAFYAYFPSKYAVLAVSLVRIREPMARVTGALADSAELLGHEEIEVAVRQLAELWRTHANLIHGVIEAATHDPELDALWTQWVEGFAEACAKVMPGVKDALEIAKALLWANERNLYRAFKISRTDESLNQVVSTLTSIWTATIAATVGGE